MSINFNEHVLGVGPNGELPPFVAEQLSLPPQSEIDAMQSTLNDYQAGQDATDTAVASVVATDGQARAALAANFTTKAKDIEGGQYPAPLRVPTLTVADTWPNSRSPRGRLVWHENDGQTLYLAGSDATLYKSTDAGATWTKRQYLNWGPFAQSMFLKTSAGTLLTVSTTGSHHVRRSTDDGLTWDTTHTFQSGWSPLGTQSWCIDKVTGHIYYGEYGTTETGANLYRSTDDGLTWAVLHTFPTATDDPDRVRHIHAVQWDPYDQRVWICVGDSTASTGLYRVNSTGAGVEAVLTNEMLPAGGWTTGGFFDAPRSIGIMPFPDYVAWASDSTNNPGVFRVARAHLGLASPPVERIYRTNSTNWFACQASEDGSRWVFCSSQEAPTTHALDRSVHLYAVEDQGATVYEIGALPMLDDASPAGSLMPVGLPEDQGRDFYMTGRGLGAVVAGWKFRIAEAASARIDYPPTSAPVTAWRTATMGERTIAPGGNYVFHADITAAFARNLRVFDANCLATDGSTGRIVIEIVNSNTLEVLYTSNAYGARQSARMEWSPFIASINLPSTQRVSFRARNVHAGESVTGLVSITYGWG